MPRDSNGNASTDPVYVATPGNTIRAVQHNTPIADIVNMLTGSLARNGTGGMLADLAMGGFKITGLADGTLDHDAVTKSQLDAAVGDLPQLGAWTNVASASTVDLGAQASRNLVITGTTTITSFGAAGAADNVPYLLRFSGVLTLTHGTDLILPGGANITTAIGDMAVVVHDDADTWRVVSYARATTAPSLSQSYWDDGTGTTEAPISPAKLAAAITGKAVAGTTYQNLLPRSLGVSYQNVTGGPVEEIIYQLAATSNNVIEISPDNFSTITYRIFDLASRTAMSYVLPDGWYVRLPTGGIITTWIRLI